MSKRISLSKISRRSSRERRHFLATSFAVLPALAACASAHAQTYTMKTLVAFSGTNGNSPSQGVTRDNSGNLYGTTAFGGTSGNGVVFKLANAGQSRRPPTARRQR